MSILDSMKSKLGFASDDERYDGDYDERYDDRYDDGYDDRYDDRYDQHDDGRYDRGDDGRYDQPREREGRRGAADGRDYDQSSARSNANLDSQVKVVPRGARTESNSSRYGASAYGSSEYGTRYRDDPDDDGYEAERPYPSQSRDRNRSTRDAAPFETSHGSYNGASSPAYSGTTVSEPEFMRNRMSSANSAQAALDEIRSQRPTSRTDGGVSARGRITTASDLDIIKPLSYNEAEKIALSFKAGNNVALSLVAMRPELAKRILDFSFGVVSALGGSVEKVSDKVFMLSHSTVGITADEEHRLRDAGIII